MFQYAIVGSGQQGTIFSSGRPVVAIADTNLEALNRAGKKMGIDPRRCFTTHTALLENMRGKVDVIVVATPPDVRQPVIDALNAGFHVIVENPLALDIKTGEVIIATVRQTNKSCLVNDQWPRLAGVQRARQMIDRGEVGEVRRVEMFGKGRHALEKEIPRIGSHLFNVVCQHWVLSLLSCSAKAFRRGADVVALFDTMSGIPLEAKFWHHPTPRDSTGYDVGSCGIEIHGATGRIKLLGGFLERLWYSTKPYDSIGDPIWEPKPWIPVSLETWAIRHGDEDRVLADPSMNPTFELLDLFEAHLEGGVDNPMPPENAMMAVEALEMINQALCHSA